MLKELRWCMLTSDWLYMILQKLSIKKFPVQDNLNQLELETHSMRPCLNLDTVGEYRSAGVCKYTAWLLACEAIYRPNPWGCAGSPNRPKTNRWDGNHSLTADKTKQYLSWAVQRGQIRRDHVRLLHNLWT